MFVQTLLESMVGAAESLCPHVLKKSNLRQDLIKAGMTKMVIPRSFVKNTLLEQSGIDIMNKIRSVLPVKEIKRILQTVVFCKALFKKIKSTIHFFTSVGLAALNCFSLLVAVVV